MPSPAIVTSKFGQYLVLGIFGLIAFVVVAAFFAALLLALLFFVAAIIVLLSARGNKFGLSVGLGLVILAAVFGFLQVGHQVSLSFASMVGL